MADEAPKEPVRTTADQLVCSTTVILDWRDRLRVLIGRPLQVKTITKVSMLVTDDHRAHLRIDGTESSAWTYKPGASLMVARKDDR